MQFLCRESGENGVGGDAGASRDWGGPFWFSVEGRAWTRAGMDDEISHKTIGYEISCLWKPEKMPNSSIRSYIAVVVREAKCRPKPGRSAVEDLVVVLRG